MTPYDKGWGDPRKGPFDTVAYDVGHGVMLRVRNADVGTIFAEAVRQLELCRVPDGSRYWRLVGPVADDWGANWRLKRWAEALGHTTDDAPLDEFSDHAWATAIDLDTARNPMLGARPADPWAHTDMPRESAKIAADLMLEWGGSWSQPWDPQHWQLDCTPQQAADLAARIRAQQEDDMADPEVIALLGRIAKATEHTDTIVTTILTQGFRATDAQGNAAPAALNSSVRGAVGQLIELKGQVAGLAAALAPPAGGAS